MLARAQERHLYDHLICQELTAFLTAYPGSFDLIVAADVFIYFGDLNPLAAALAAALKPGGLLAFSTESAPTPGYTLLTSGRFAHHPDTVQSTLKSHFTPLFSQETTLRLEATLPVPGHLFVFRCN
jgi:predicted TPR repeat methyltransferase